MRKYNYTMQATCTDGVRRNFEHSGYFASMDIFLATLARWTGPADPNGGIYVYFQTEEQRLNNYNSPLLPKDYRYPIFSLLWNGPQMHNFLLIK